MIRKIIAYVLTIIIIIISNIVPCAAETDAISNEVDSKIITIKTKVGDSTGAYIGEEEYLIKDGTVYVNDKWIKNRLGLNLKVINSTLDTRIGNDENLQIQEIANEYKDTFSDSVNNIELQISKKNSNLIYYFREGCNYAFAISSYFGVYKINIGSSVLAEKGFWFPMIGILEIFDSYCYVRDESLIVGKPSITVIDILHSNTFNDYYYDIVTDYGETEGIFKAKYNYYNFYSRLKNYVQGALKFDIQQFRNALTYDEMSDALALQLCTFDTAEAQSNRDNIANTALMVDIGSAAIDGYARIAEKVANGSYQHMLDVNNELGEILADKTGFYSTDDFFKALQNSNDAMKESEKATKVFNNIKTVGDTLKHSFAFLNAYLVYLNGINELNHVNRDAVSAVEVFLNQYNQESKFQEYNIGAAGIQKKLSLYKHTKSLYENDELLDNVVIKLTSSEIAIFADASYEQLCTIFPSSFGDAFPVILVTTLGWDLSEGLVNIITNKSFEHLDSALQMHYVTQLESVAETILNDYKYRISLNKDCDLDEYRKLEWIRLKSYYLARESMLLYGQKTINKYPDEMKPVVENIKAEENTLLQHMSVLLSGVHMGRKPSDYANSEDMISEINGNTVTALEELDKNNIMVIEIINDDEIIEQYKSFIQSQSDRSCYSIYDIDKDGYPELFFYESHAQERDAFCDIYYYRSGNFELLERTHGPGFWHVWPTYASYPNGNGMVEYGAVKGYEFVNVQTLNDGMLNTEEVYYSKEGAKYYLDSGDQAYYESHNNNPINHQYYQSETSCPYFEGSYLLGRSAMNDYTALNEAFSDFEEIEPSAEIQNDTQTPHIITFSDVSLLNESESKDIVSNADGETYSVEFETFDIDDYCAGLDLSVNDNKESFSLSGDRIYFAFVDSVYVADIDSEDSYGNFIAVLGGEDGEMVTYVFAFNENEIQQVESFHGEFVPESINGNTTMLLTYNLGMPAPSYGCFTVRPEITVSGLSAEQSTLHCGKTTYSGEEGYFEEGVGPTIDTDLDIYAEPECVTYIGSIPAGNYVDWMYISYQESVYDWTIYVNSGDLEGYVLFRNLRKAA